MDSLSWEAALPFLVLPPWVSLRKEFAPMGANSVLFGVDPSEGFYRPRKQTGSQKGYSHL